MVGDAVQVGTAVQLAAIASVAPPTLRAAVPDGERTSSLATGYAALASRARLGGTKAQGQLAWQPRANDSVRAELRQAASPSWTERMRAELFAKESTRGERASDAPAVAPNIEPIADAAPSPVATESGYFSSLRFLGQLDRTYLVCEGAGELVLVDQHSAHERAEFHKLREAHRRRGADGAGGATTVAVQRLLFATSMDATATQLAVAQSAATVLADVGFEVEPFSGGKLAVKTVPAGLRHSDPQVVLRQLLDDLAEVGTAAAVDAYVDRAFSTIACHSALRAGDRLDAPAAEALLRTLDDAFRGTDESTAQPHGRPVLLRLGVADLARRFGR